MINRRAQVLPLLACAILGVCLVSRRAASTQTTLQTERKELEIHTTWLSEKDPKDVWEQPGNRVALPKGLLLRDDTVASGSDWVIIDNAKRTTRVPRGRFVQYLTKDGLSSAPPASAEDAKQCAVFMGAGDTAFFVDVSEATVCCVELKSKPAPSTPEQIRKQKVREIAASAALLPGAHVSVQWFPKAFNAQTDFRTTCDRGSLLTDDLLEEQEWVVLDANRKQTRIPRKSVLKYLTANGLTNMWPSDANELVRSALLVCGTDSAVLLDVEKGAACRVEIHRY